MSKYNYVKQRVIYKENEMTDEVKQEIDPAVVAVTRQPADGAVPYPDTVILPDEWSEFQKAAWHDRQLDAYNTYYGLNKPNDASS